MCAAIHEIVNATNADVVVFAGGFSTAVDGLVEVSRNESATAAERKFPTVDAFWEVRCFSCLSHKLRLCSFDTLLAHCASGSFDPEKMVRGL